jgi:hypothetical protein
MNMATRLRGEGSSARGPLKAAVLSVSVLLGACDGANQGVQIGNGQSPDPVVIDYPIAYVAAPLPLDDDGMFEQQDLREQITFDVGGQLLVKERASASADPVNVTEDIIGDMGAVRDVEIAYDGSTVLFAMRGPFDPNLDDDEQPTWNIWEYAFEDQSLRRIIASDLTAEIGHDVMPKYLPDGRIIFASTRQVRSRAILLDEGKSGFAAMDEDRNEEALNLHVINADGSGIEQVTFNQSHDMDPTVLSNGQIVFARWDHAPGNNDVNLYRMNPDGTGLELFYGSESHATGTNGELIQFTQPRETEDGGILSLVRPFTATEGGGDVFAIDTQQYVEIAQPLKENIGVLTGPAQEPATTLDISTLQGVPSEGGRISSVYPIQDGTGRMLISWSQCRLQDVVDPTINPPPPVQIYPCTEERLANPTAYEPAQPLYGIWIYDPRGNSQLPVVPGEEGVMFTEVVSGDPRPTPPAIPDSGTEFPYDPTLRERGEAVINIRNVYDFNGELVADVDTLADPLQSLAADRPARFLRIEKAVSLPDPDLLDFDESAFGVSAENGMRETVGYAEVEPDGSVVTRVPANVALAISVLDADGKRITQRHNAWLSLVPGQELKCNGCHLANQGVSHGRADAFESAYAGGTTPGASFPNTDPKWFIGEVGETMAEVRARVSCTTEDCSAIEPTMAIRFEDVWTADPTIRAINEPFDYNYDNSQELMTPSPTNAVCPTLPVTPPRRNWQAQCRNVINYETHIHPMWGLPRLAFNENGAPIIDPTTGLQRSDKCQKCHSPTDPDTNLVRIPAGQLDLSDGPSPDEPMQFNSYRELLAPDNQQEIVNGALVDILRLTGQDEDGNDILEPITIAPPMQTAGATASSAFFDPFDDRRDLHYNILTETERALLAEWLDLGAQYFNNPFDAPLN